MRKQNMSSPSPVTDGDRVWVMTGTGILKAFDFDGKELWMRDIQRDYGRFGQLWGYGSSPLLYEDSLYVQVLHGCIPTILRTCCASTRRRADDLAGRAPHVSRAGIAGCLHDADAGASRWNDGESW